MTIRVAGIGTALPEKIVTNDELAKTIDTNDQWIRDRSGIGQRHVGGVTSELATEAGIRAIKNAGLTPDDIGLLIVCTTTPDQQLPATSAVVQRDIGLTCGAFDINAVCAGFIYSYVMAYGQMLMPGGPERVLVIGSESLSRIVDWTDRGTAILFGDGAGAAVMERHEQGEMLAYDLGSNGELQEILYADHGGYIKMEGREVFKRAVRAVSGSVEIALKKAGMTADDIDVVIPHQANIRIIEAVSQRTGLSMEKTHNVIEFTGNTSSATIPLTLAEAERNGALQPGQIVLMTGFGAGMAWGTAVVRW
ncbi:MAG: beta-ketoacyl-ACP synthase III [Acidimicrobiales bacterium]|jgi:3-oxoacyl-[acyl-carrier-protein] synthase III|nr:beta-ketoacyl-ACP synthase III [Actinomycetota bacterium]